MADVTINIKRKNGVNISATSTDIDDNAVIEIAMMLGALVFDAASNPLTEATTEVPEVEHLPVPMSPEVMDIIENQA